MSILNLRWCILMPFHLFLSLVSWEKGLTLCLLTFIFSFAIFSLVCNNYVWIWVFMVLIPEFFFCLYNSNLNFVWMQGISFGDCWEVAYTQEVWVTRSWPMPAHSMPVSSTPFPVSLILKSPPFVPGLYSYTQSHYARARNLIFYWR